MKFLSLSALALLLLSVEAVVVKSLGFDVTRIDVCVAILVYVGLRGTTLEGAFTAFAVGYLLDVMTGRPTGLYPFLGVLVFLCARAVSQLVDGRSRIAFALFTGVATFGHALLAFLFTVMTTRDGQGRVLSLSGVPLQVVLSMLAALVLYPVLKKIEPGERVKPGLLQ
jgi:rod shape-determining protein MreD